MNIANARGEVGVCIQTRSLPLKCPITQNRLEVWFSKFSQISSFEINYLLDSSSRTIVHASDLV